MKKSTAAALLALVLAAGVQGAQAEISSNLNMKQTFTRHGMVEKERYVNAQGETVMAEDKGYAYLISESGSVACFVY